jgi:RNA polymerase sigma-70 factor (ECF subfamily)
LALEQNIQIAIIGKAKLGDETAFELLYNHYSNAMYSICLRMVAEKNDAEDLLQEVFIIAFKSLSQLKDNRQFGGWLKRIAVNECIRFCKKRLKTNCWDDIYFDEKIDDDTHWWQEVSLSALQTAIRTLPDGCRQVFNLYAIEDYSHKEIANCLNISESTSKSQYHRARKLLKELILNKIKNYG